MYPKCGSTDQAHGVFDYTMKKNNVLWSSMVTAYSQSGRNADALQLFEREENSYQIIQPNYFMFFSFQVGHTGVGSSQTGATGPTDLHL